MRKIILLVALAFTLQLAAQINVSRTFDFSKPRQLTPSVTPKENVGGSISVLDKKFTNGPIQISFEDGSEQRGVYITTMKNMSTGAIEYFLSIESSSSMIISSTDNNVNLNQIEFVNPYTFGDLYLNSGGGVLEYRTWKSNENDKVKEVTFSVSGFRSEQCQIKVSYSTPSDVLEPTADIAQNSTIDYFEAISLTFDEEVEIKSNDRIILKNGTVEYDLVPTVEGKVVKLSAPSRIELDGNYTITLPANYFKTKEGFGNKALTYNFNVIVPKATFMPSEISPKTGRVEKLSGNIVLSFPSDISDFSQKTITMEKDGNPFRTWILERSSSNSKVAILRMNSVTTDITDNGIYTINIPEKLFYNGLKGDAQNERWNSTITLEYEISSEPMPDSETMLLAKQLLLNQGVGFPKATSEAFTELKSLVDANPVSSDADLLVAIDKYYIESDVYMPSEDKWYHIASVNAEGNKLYLNYNDGIVKLTSDEQKASAFKVHSANGGKTSFVTIDDHYLHILTASDVYDGTSSKNVTDTYSSDINDLALTKLSVNNVSMKLQLGFFSIYGCLGKNAASMSVNANALVNHSTETIATDVSLSTLFFDNTLSSGFSFTEVPEPIIEPDPVSLECTLTSTVPSNTSLLSLVFSTDKVVTLSGNETASFVDAQGKNVGTASINAVNGTTNQFTISLSGMNDGNYKLFVPTGVFVCNVDGIEHKVTSFEKAFSIITPEDNFVEDFYFGVYNEPDYYAKDTYFNEFIIYSSKEMYCDETKEAFFAEYLNPEKVARKGTFKPYTIPEAPYLNAYKFTFDKPITEGELVSTSYTFVIEAATFGDSNFEKYLNGDSNVKKSKCHVNAKTTLGYYIDNNKASSVNGITVDEDREQRIVDLLGRKVNKMQKGNMYIVNGKKFIKE